MIDQLKKYGFESSTSGWKKYLELAKKDERGIPRTTGTHRVRFIKDEIVRDVNVFVGKEKTLKVQGIRYYFFENGEEKIYDVPLYQKDYYVALVKGGKRENKYHYLLDKFADIEEGDEIEIEYIQKGEDGFIDVRRVSDGVVVSDDDFVVNEKKSEEKKIDVDPFSEPLGSLDEVEKDFKRFMNEIG